MKSVALCLVIAAVACQVAYATNYCSTTICNANPSTHIACGNSGAWASTCPSDAQMVTVTSSLQSTLINGHNAKRNSIAGGGDVKHSKACRMPTMSWDNELASLAALNVKQCQMKHDRCRNTDSFKYAGQNLAYMSYYEPLNAQAMFEQAIQMWFNEVQYSNMTYINSYPSNYNGPAIGHFTVMVADKNIKLGCAASTYSVTGPGYKMFLVACNYATTNIEDFPVYASCSSAASGCTTGTNPAYPNLCSASEVVDPNKLWQIKV